MLKMSKRIGTIFLLIILSALQVRAEKEFKDVIVVGKYICGLTSEGKLKFYDKQTGLLADCAIQYSAPITRLAADKSDNLVIADKSNAIKKYNAQNQSWELIAKVKANLYGILFDSKNQCYGITDEGILDVQTNKTYFSNESLNHQIHYKDKWGEPYCYYMDKSDRIWLGFGYGEWGGDLFVFETAENKFLTPKLDSFNIALLPIKSFFEDAKYTYLSAGLQHMMTSGAIIKFDNLKATTLFIDSFLKKSQTNADSSVEAEYIEAAAYSQFDNAIYFYSQNGFFKGDETKDLSKFENWQNILKPQLHWTYGQPDAVGYAMNVLKMLIIGKEKFVFLTQNDGIGFYDGEKLTLLQ